MRTPDREAEARSIQGSSPPPPTPDTDSSSPCPSPTPMHDQNRVDGFGDAVEEKPKRKETEVEDPQVKNTVLSTGQVWDHLPT